MTGGTGERRESVDDADRLAALFGNLSEPTVEYAYEDGEPIVLAVNEAFEEVFGYSREEIVGECLDDFIVPDEKAEEADRLNEKVADGELLEAEVRRKTADGIRSFMLRDAPIETTDGNRGFAIYADISDRVRRERALQRQNERLAEFASVVSHDLRNPLTVARGYLEAAYDDPGTFLPEVETSLDRMEDIIEDVLTLARQGEEVGDPSRVDLEEVARTAWRNVETDGATLRVEDTRDLDADRDRLLHVFENLFGNSVEHALPDESPHADGEGSASTEEGSASTEEGPASTEEGPASTEEGPASTEEGSTADGRGPAADATERGELAVRVGTIDGGFYVEDDGPGIPERHRDRVFESGFTTSESGTGFGLSIVQRICEAHGWRVELTEGPEGGARFEVRGLDRTG